MRKKVVIIGGGFAGLQFARKLNNDKDFKVMMVDKENHHSFQPLFYQVASGRLDPSNISFPFRKIFQKSKNIQFRMDEVLEILPEENRIICENGSFTYDELVIATGCKSNYFGNTEIQKYTFGMKTTQESLEIKNNILLTFEKIMRERNNTDPGNWNIVIVGSGPTGVELAGAFAEMKKNILPRDYPYMNFENLKIYMVSGTEMPLATMSKESQEASLKYLQELGVTCMGGKFVESYDGKTIKMTSGETITTNNVIWAAGVTGNILPGLAPENTIRGRYIVDRFNRVKDYKNIYAIGDIAYMETPLYPHGHPQLANVAVNQGKNLGDNLKKQNPKNWKEYEYKDLGSMATVGKHKAVVDLPKFSFQGFFAWYVWMFLHLMLILSVRNKLAIFINWAWSYLYKDSSLRLILRDKKRLYE
ncbi:NADH dehydrogenase [Elizabethkingia meningoseptica]|uniref:NADH:ubiquinone reductase (non-electrogenic) n=1 Tax=Elizabethkingia meningoseptica TaxID=238 RepID=A0A1V3U1K4_ELIME|nr:MULTISPECIES: NAD(P)/FAD-dependent oxidoreductase [Elizabethkingia]AQX13481.1 NADH dehydrogenase [Elizabethkingia meningoseptica]EJK5327622.1 NAD(P)/FAD-dependent oxidoreductase [Elizabethkingia meningoseptica]MBG0515127.1 NAD(P)/FAD-dependent oxidoreductase [Elizabethkingia meningoseptica]MDE5429572.1 NAD(P)/FAD-dependent oxidoreductase [Elizabethkingia meningoseptica]MDE5434373.1 NAD(P)/FAD-dependent oxidoreductase [Elizabethkingia meningoseptica]